jgi:adenylosuccinate synthase
MTRGPGLRAFAVVDLGFGDAGKGLFTDFLVRRTRADVVVRFNGGAQAGHNVVTADGRHHTFAQVGAGSFTPGVRTFLSRHVVIHPTALLEEVAALAKKGVHDALSRIAVSEQALVVTPYHQAANRLREIARGENRHGSCGVGVGEAVHAAELSPADALRAADLRDRARLHWKLASVRDRLREEMLALARPRTTAAEREWRIFDDPEVAARWCDRSDVVAECVVPDETLGAWLRRSSAVVFEGAQGLLLDATLGFHPHTTWSDCTAANARALLADASHDAQLRVWGVLRAHAIRHGAGPLPTEDAALAGLVREHNATNEWQGRVRYGWFDAVLARYALALTPELDALALTHVDALARRTDWSLCDAYTLGSADREGLIGRSSGNRVLDLAARAETTLDRQSRLGALLSACEPERERVPADEALHVRCIEQRIGRSIEAISRGPTAADVELRTPGAIDTST